MARQLNGVLDSNYLQIQKHSEEAKLDPWRQNPLYFGCLSTGALSPPQKIDIQKDYNKPNI